MTNRTVKDHASSIRGRLFAHARMASDDFQRVLTRYAIERLLFRLGRTEAAERFVLKGAMLFATWPKHVFRPTGDLDLLGRGDPGVDALREAFIRICRVELPADGIVFDAATLKVEPVREAERYQGARLNLKARLGSAVIPVQIDVGFGDHVHPPPKREIFPPLLPGLPQADVLMYPPETVIAEKFEAMIRFGEANTRIKDFYDLWVIARVFPLDLSDVVEAVRGTLARRQLAPPTGMPVGLTSAFATVAEERALWAGFLRRMSPVMEPPSFPRLQDDLRRFFGPVIQGLGAPEGVRGRWDPDRGAWQEA